MIYTLHLQELCLPSADATVEQLISTVHKYKANSVFLARDSKSYDGDIISAMNKLSVSVIIVYSGVVCSEVRVEYR